MKEVSKLFEILVNKNQQNSEPYIHMSHNIFSRKPENNVFFNIYQDNKTDVIRWKPGMSKWEKMPSLNIPRREHCTVGNGLDTLWVVGGCKECWGEGFIERFTLSSNKWEKLNGTPHAVDKHGRGFRCVDSCVFWGDHIYVTLFQGYTTVHEMIHVFNTVTGQWLKPTTKVRRRKLGSAAAVIPQ